MIVIKREVAREDAKEAGEEKGEDKKEVIYSPVREINIDARSICNSLQKKHVINVIQELFSIISIDKPKTSVDKLSESIFFTDTTAQ